MFKEILKDHDYHKYQSKINSSWYVGFDLEGNPIPARDFIKHDGSLESIKRDRCFQFRKLYYMKTTTSLFPHANRLIDSPEALAESLAQLRKQNFEYGGTNGETDNDENPDDYLEEGDENTPSFNQRQLLNMTRYRNILRYQLGRRANQPIMSMESCPLIDSSVLNSSGNPTIATSNNNSQSSSRTRITTKKRIGKKKPSGTGRQTKSSAQQLKHQHPRPRKQNPTGSDGGINHEASGSSSNNNSNSKVANNLDSRSSGEVRRGKRGAHLLDYQMRLRTIFPRARAA